MEKKSKITNVQNIWVLPEMFRVEAKTCRNRLKGQSYFFAAGKVLKDQLSNYPCENYGITRCNSIPSIIDNKFRNLLHDKAMSLLSPENPAW